MMKKLILFLWMFQISAPAAIQVEVLDPAYDEYEGLQLAEALLSHGQNTKAEKVLAALSETEKSSALFTKLTGDLYFQRKEYTKAREKYLKALSKNETKGFLKDELVQALLAESHFQLKEYSDCRIAYRKAGVSLSNRQRVLKSECEFQSGNWGEAWETLKSASPSLQIQRQKIEFLLKLRLVREAEVQAGSFFSQENLSAAECLGLADLFQASKHSPEALRLMELIRLKFPMDPEVLLSWAQLAYQKNWSRQTVEAFALAAFHRPQLHYQTAELYRQLGHFTASQYHSSFIEDPSKRLKAEVALAVDRNDYFQIAALEGPLSRSLLQQDDDVNYAMSFSLFRKGLYGKAISYLDRVQKPEMMSRSLALRRAIEAKNNVWELTTADSRSLTHRILGEPP